MMIYNELPDRTTIFGPPGTGKTYALANIFMSYITSGRDDAIYITYSRSMAQESRKRMDVDRAIISTFHSAFTRFLNWSMETFLTDNDYTEFSKNAGIKKTTTINADDEIDEDEDDLTRFLRAYNYLYFRYGLEAEKHIREMKEFYTEGIDFEYLFDKYNEFKFRKGKSDYTDIITEVLKDVSVLPSTGLLLVDEVQDMRPIMWKILDKWYSSGKVDKLVLAGDDDQNIYYYDGADVRDMLRYASNTRKIYLRQSYRIPRQIRDVAIDTIRQISTRERKDFLPAEWEGRVIYSSSLEDAIRMLTTMEGTKFILARTKYYVMKATEILHIYRIPYLVINPNHSMLTPYSMSVIEMANIFIDYPPKDFEDMRKIIVNLPADIMVRGIKSKFEDRKYDRLPQNLFFRTDEYFNSFFKKKYNKYEILDMMDISAQKKRAIRNLVLQGKRIDVDNIIRVDTIHAAKGREADNVLLILNTTRKIYRQMFSDTNIYDSELRIKYVAITRARKNIILVTDPRISPLSV
jgi:DNA helicase-2/ATP-dependent DNA helicase PcrA